MYKNILVPTDGLERCKRGTCHGILLAKSLKAKITAVCITKHLSAQEILDRFHEGTPWEYSNRPMAQAAILDAEESHREPAEKALQVVERMCAENGVPCEKVYLEEDSPADGIMEVARMKGCDLIFLSTHGDQGIMGQLFGTIATSIMSHSKDAVLVHHCGGPV